MRRFKVGDRAKLVYAKCHKYLVGKTCTITAVGPFMAVFDFGIRAKVDYTVEFDDGTTIDDRGWGAFDNQLAPIDDVGSWKEIEEATKWNPTKELEFS